MKMVITNVLEERMDEDGMIWNRHIACIEVTVEDTYCVKQRRCSSLASNEAVLFSLFLIALLGTLRIIKPTEGSRWPKDTRSPHLLERSCTFQTKTLT
jgi:hypothetical protein